MIGDWRLRSSVAAALVCASVPLLPRNAPRAWRRNGKLLANRHSCRRSHLIGRTNASDPVISTRRQHRGGRAPLPGQNTMGGTRGAERAAENLMVLREERSIG